MIHLELLDLENVAKQFGFQVTSFRVNMTESGEPAEAQYSFLFREKSKEGFYVYADSIGVAVLISRFPGTREEMNAVETMMKLGTDFSGKMIPLHKRKISNYIKFKLSIMITVDNMTFRTFNVIERGELKADVFMKNLTESIKNINRIPNMMSNLHHMFDENPGLIEPEKPINLKTDWTE